MRCGVARKSAEFEEYEEYEEYKECVHANSLSKYCRNQPA